MSLTPLRPSKPRILVAAAGLFFLGAAQASDLYDSLKTWNKQSEEARKIREERDGLQPPAAPEESQRSPTDPRGPMGPARTDMNDEQPATEQPAPQTDEASREQIPNDPHKPSP